MVGRTQKSRNPKVMGRRKLAKKKKVCFSGGMSVYVCGGELKVPVTELTVPSTFSYNFFFFFSKVLCLKIFSDVSLNVSLAVEFPEEALHLLAF